MEEGDMNYMKFKSDLNVDEIAGILYDQMLRECAGADGEGEHDCGFIYELTKIQIRSIDRELDQCIGLCDGLSEGEGAGVVDQLSVFRILELSQHLDRVCKILQWVNLIRQNFVFNPHWLDFSRMDMVLESLVFVLNVSSPHNEFYDRQKSIITLPSTPPPLEDPCPSYGSMNEFSVETNLFFDDERISRAVDLCFFRISHIQLVAIEINSYKPKDMGDVFNNTFSLYAYHTTRAMEEIEGEIKKRMRKDGVNRYESLSRCRKDLLDDLYDNNDLGKKEEAMTFCPQFARWLVDNPPADMDMLGDYFRKKTRLLYMEQAMEAVGEQGGGVLPTPSDGNAEGEETHAALPVRAGKKGIGPQEENGDKTNEEKAGEKDALGDFMPIFKNSVEFTSQFLHEIEGAKPKAVAGAVQKYWDSGLIQNGTSQRTVYEMLKKHGLYSPTESNFNSKVSFRKKK